MGDAGDGADGVGLAYGGVGYRVELLPLVLVVHVRHVDLEIFV